jgi:hypothetical protein
MMIHNACHHTKNSLKSRDRVICLTHDAQQKSEGKTLERVKMRDSDMEGIYTDPNSAIESAKHSSVVRQDTPKRIDVERHRG